MAKLRKLGKGIDKWLMELKGQGYSNKDIANEILKVHGVYVHPTSIGKYLKRRFLFAASYARGQARTRQDSEEFIGLIKDDMKKIRDELWKLIKQLKLQQDTQAIGTQLERLSKHLIRMNELMAQVSSVSFEQVDVVGMSTKIGMVLKKLEKEGFIEIKKELPEGGIAEV